MKRFVLILAGLLVGQLATAQEADRYGILPNTDLYKQDTPKDALGSVILAIERERFDYLAAHLLPKEFVDGRIKKNAGYYEKVAAEQISKTAVGATLKGAELQAKIKSTADLLGFRQIIDTMAKKQADEPDTLRTLKRFLREGKFEEAGDTVSVTLDGVKDRAIFLKKIEGRWYFENRREAPAAKE